ncbi:MAG: Omp28-related outer membrane protein [Chitinophagales bacterium]|nr:Omp28-related outer membrane protein [Chitinophagaceae bacterium]MCB9065798.1 Omp28-related outer membrane protein [Chitinophagales bacterium]
MKNNFLLLTVSCLILSLYSCKEKGSSSVILDEEIGKLTDTAYTADVEATTPRKLLAEEFTGVSCPPCAHGHEIMASIKEQLNGNIVIIGYHISNHLQTRLVEKNGKTLSKFDFRTEDATNVGLDIFAGVNEIPQAGFDRTEIKSGTKIAPKADWSNAAIQRSKIPTPLNIHITSSFDEATRECTAVVKLAYTGDVNLNQNLNFAVLEDDIIDAQKTLTSEGIDENYRHKHVLRDLVTSTSGDPLPDKAYPLTEGRVYERTFSFQVPDEWNAANCKIVAFVNNNSSSDRTIVQAEEVTMTGK